MKATIISDKKWAWQNAQFFPIKVHFDIIDSKSGKWCGRISEDVTHISKKLDNPNVFPNICWLCNDFIVVWKGEELGIWYLQSLERIATIDIKGFCRLGEPKYSDSIFSPVKMVEISNGKICLILQNIEGTECKVVRYVSSSQ